MPYASQRTAPHRNASGVNEPLKSVLIDAFARVRTRSNAGTVSKI